MSAVPKYHFKKLYNVPLYRTCFQNYQVGRCYIKFWPL